ncbi:MAG: Fe-S cluster assembly protein SufB [Candidatus Thiodiazotropha sp.]
MGLPDTEMEALIRSDYAQGFVTEIESDTLPPGLDEDVIRAISARKGEPSWMLEKRLTAYRHWLTLQEPNWAEVRHPPIDFQAISYYSSPKKKPALESLDQVDPELLATYEKLGIPIDEQKALSGVAVDAVFDSVSVATTFRKTLAEAGVIFCSMSEAIREYPELSTYFRINEANTGQFERTLIVAEEGSSVSYLEGCTAPTRDENQLHAAVVELVALEDARIKYSTVQNWYPGDNQGRGGIYNFVTKRGDCRGDRSHISWTQVETGSAVTWKYPSCILRGKDTVGEFYSVAVTKGMQQADTGTKMIHIGENSRSTIVSKGISAMQGSNAYRGLVRIAAKAENARNHTQCDSLLIGDRCSAHTFPYIEVKNPTAQVEHEATTSKVSEDQLFYCRQRGLSQEDAVSMIINGFCKEVFKELPMEFAVEAQKLLAVSLEGAVG